MATRPPLLLITIDGLRAAALGAYGATAYETPAFDRFATRALTHQWCFAQTPTAIDLLRTVAGAAEGTLLLSDDAEWLDQASELPTAECVALPAGQPEEVANGLGETAIAEAMFAATEQLVGLSESADHLLQWLHLRGLYGPWDAPVELHEDLLSEEDPEITVQATPVQLSHDDPQSGEACEARFAAACRYAAQVRAIDTCLGGLLATIPQAAEGRTVVLAGARGYPLGEHGQIGGVDPRLFSEQHHTPLLIRGSGIDAFSQSNRPVGLATTLASLLSDGDCDPETLAPLVLNSPNNARGLRTERWYLRAPASQEPAETETAELYVKPDDRWDHNDVAKLCVDETEELLSQLAGVVPSS